MAEFQTDGLTEFIRQLEQDDLFNDEVAGEMLFSMADEMVDSVQKKMRSTRYDMARLSKKVGYTKKIKNEKNGGKSVTVSVKGKNARGERNATVVFVLNYGRREEYGRLAPMHFWDSATQETIDKAQEIAENAATEYYKSKGLI